MVTKDEWGSLLKVRVGEGDYVYECHPKASISVLDS